MNNPDSTFYTFRGWVLSDDLQKSIDRYVKHRIPPGDFLLSCLCNNLSEAVSRADVYNYASIPVITSYLLNRVPAQCWGSAEAVRAWLNGRPDDDEHFD